MGRLVDDADSIRALLTSARVIAVVGLSGKTHRPSHGVAAYLQQQGYRIIPVNPNEAEVLGEKCYPDLASVPEKIDIVDCFRKTEEIASVVEEAIAVGARCVWMQLGIADPAAAARAQSAGLDVVMNRCIKVDHAALRRN